MSGQHTKGPWFVSGPFVGPRLSSGCGIMIKVARLAGDEADDEVIANANLISAAPDLLSACEAWNRAEDARNDCTECENEGPWEHCAACSEWFGDAIDMRHAAIAKATGAA